MKVELPKSDHAEQGQGWNKVCKITRRHPEKYQEEREPEQERTQQAGHQPIE
jgi:hypothetical protein